MKKYKANKIVGIVTLCINILFLFNPIYIYYYYNFTCCSFLMMVPNWLLLINALLGMLGISLSIMLYKGVIALKWFLILTGILWLIILLTVEPFGIEWFIYDVLRIVP